MVWMKNEVVEKKGVMIETHAACWLKKIRLPKQPCYFDIARWRKRNRPGSEFVSLWLTLC